MFCFIAHEHAIHPEKQRQAQPQSQAYPPLAVAPSGPETSNSADPQQPTSAFFQTQEDRFPQLMELALQRKRLGGASPAHKVLQNPEACLSTCEPLQALAPGMEVM